MDGLTRADRMVQVNNYSNVLNQNINELTLNIYNIFRIENRLPVHGSELIDKYNPLEANLLDNISFNKGCYVGQEVVARLNAYDKIRMQLVFIYLDKNCDPATDMTIISGSNQVGVLTSFEFSNNISYTQVENGPFFAILPSEDTYE